MSLPQLFKALDNVKDQAKDAFFALTGGCLNLGCIGGLGGLTGRGATVKINGRSFKIIKVLGEGGFSFVYLAEDEGSGVSLQ